MPDRPRHRGRIHFEHGSQMNLLRTCIADRLEFSPDGQLLLSHHRGEQSNVWETRTGRLIAQNLLLTVFGFHPTLPLLVGMLNTNDFGQVDPATSHSQPICRVGSWWPIPNEAAEQPGRAVWFWSAQRGLLTHDGSRLVAVSSPSRSEIAMFGTASDGNAGPVWQVQTQHRGNAPRTSIAVLPDDQLAVAEDFHNPRTRLVVRSLSTGDELSSRRLPCKSFSDMAIDPAGRMAVFAAGPSLIGCELGTSLGRPRTCATIGTKDLNSIAFHPSGRSLAVASNDRSVHVLDPRTWHELHAFSWDIGRVKAVAISPVGDIAAASGEEGTVIWDVDW